jgi:hypothetical protein
MHHSETDVMTGSFIASGAVANESGKFYNREIRHVGILNHGSDVSAATECAASGTFREDLSGVGDAFGANRAEAVATVKIQREPPRVSIKATRAIKRRKPKAQSGPWKRG